MSENSEIILVHGLWYGAWTMRRLGRHLQEMGFTVRRFDYAATSRHLQTNISDLHRFATSVNLTQQHFLGHSLGGLLILNMISAFEDLAPGRVVLLGTPLGGSSVARKLARVPGSSHLLGLAKETLQLGYAEIPSQREVGMIAGSVSIGLGLLVGGAGGPGDGTVGLHETRAQGLKDHVVLPVTHSGLVYSSEVARQAGEFFNKGRFKVEQTGD